MVYIHVSNCAYDGGSVACYGSDHRSIIVWFRREWEDDVIWWFIKSENKQKLVVVVVVAAAWEMCARMNVRWWVG